MESEKNRITSGTSHINLVLIFSISLLTAFIASENLLVTIITSSPQSNSVSAAAQLL